MATRARELAAAGREVISFGAGEPDFPTPPHIVEAARRAAADPANHHYTANPGLPSLRAAIASYVGEHSKVEVSPRQVVVTNGAKQAIFETFAALLDPGDEALLPSPHWVTYPAGIELAGGVPVPVPSDASTGHKVGVADLERHRTARTKLVVFVSPSNPTGAVYSEEECRAIAEWAGDKGIWVVADEIYQRLVYGEDEVAPSIGWCGGDMQRVVLVNGVAKSFAMTGWRVGWLCAPDDLVDAVTRYHSHSTGNVNNVAQAAALEALTGPQDSVVAMREAFDKRRQAMVGMLSESDGVRLVEPEGAFYVFPDVTNLLGGAYPSSAALAEGLLEEEAVAVVPGESFGAPGHLRLSYALSDAELERGVTRMLAMFGRL